MKIVIIGSGYVGTTAAAIFSVSGHSVTAIDIDESKVNEINNGKAPFYEDGLDNLISEGVKRGTLIATKSYDSISEADVVFSCVGTPDNPDGSSNLSYVYGTAEEAAKYLKKGAVFVQKSTVPVGTGREVSKLMPEGVSYVSNPEFLRESTAIYDTLMFDRVVAGGKDEKANQIVLDLHRSVEEKFDEISKISGVEFKENTTGIYVSTQLESAELIKVTANAFLAVKISFANSIAQLCDKTGADIKEVMSVVGEDPRIGKAFFNAGRGYGGGCFPKDVAGLISTAESFGTNNSIMKAVHEVNEQMPGYILNRLKNIAELDGAKVTVLGLSFKSGTSDTRKSPAIIMANTMVKEGAKVTVYDPQANEEAKPDLHESVTIAGSTEDALSEASIVIVATDWPEFKDIDKWSKSAPRATVVVDTMNCLNKDSVEKMSVEYISVGRNI